MFYRKPSIESINSINCLLNGLFCNVIEINRYLNNENIDENPWRGVSMHDIYSGVGPWNYYTSPISPSHCHTVLFQLPINLKTPPKPHYVAKPCHWNSGYARMPFASENVFPVQGRLQSRWDLIQCALLNKISSVDELEDAIFSYNTRKFKFSALRCLLEEVFVEEETHHFFNVLLPCIAQRALQLPELLPGSIPLLKQGKSHSVSLSQLQISSLLANAFFCTFSKSKEQFNYPAINFNRLFEMNVSPDSPVIEKIKCLLHYFRKVCCEVPLGVVTFERKCLTRDQLPRWDALDTKISDVKLHVSDEGTIEDNGIGLLQVDFANCFVGGGVLASGSVQEEIRFVINPELLVSRLFTEKLGSLEALIVKGAERYSCYKGYAGSFSWAGNYQDSTPYDADGRKQTSVVAIDALHFSKRSDQYSQSNMLRELNKAYTGFSVNFLPVNETLPPVATGNWGCGAFNGDVNLKSVLQLMACAASGRHMVYFTYGNANFRNKLSKIHIFLVEEKITVCQLWKYLCNFPESKCDGASLFDFIEHIHYKPRNLPQSILKSEVLWKSDIKASQTSNNKTYSNIFQSDSSVSNRSFSFKQNQDELGKKKHVVDILYSSDEDIFEDGGVLSMLEKIEAEDSRLKDGGKNLETSKCVLKNTKISDYFHSNKK